MNGRTRPPYDPWRDADGTPIPVQVAVAKGYGALRTRLHQQGELTGRGHRLGLFVRFDGEAELASIRPHLLWVLPPGTGGGNAPG